MENTLLRRAALAALVLLPGAVLASEPNDRTTGSPVVMEISGEVVALNTWFLPSSARASGVGGAFYTTDLTVANTGDTLVSFTLKFLGNNTDGRNGAVRTFALAAGASVTYNDVLGSVFGLTADYGAIRVTSASAAVAVTSQTSTPGAGGTFGQSVPTFGPQELITTASPRSLLAIREDAAFRTNVVLTNATEAPLDVDAKLVSAEGVTLATKKYSLLPLGMTQASRVVRDMGVADDVVGARLVLSTATTDGAFAAYAVAIDNGTNDPRTILPR